MVKKILCVFGTRPEGIKMCPVINELKARKKFEVLVCVTGQHREMLDGILDIFGVVPNYNLNVMKENQSLFELNTEILLSIREVLEDIKPDLVLVHGDTSSAFATSFACFCLKIPVGHIEAGLRTYDISSPYPEEFNRRAIDIMSRYNFAPTEVNKNNLLREGCSPDTVYVTGNTVVDALKYTVDTNYTHHVLKWASDSRMVIITAHRRENLGPPMRSMFRAIRRALEEYEDVKAVYPVHANPLVRECAYSELGDCRKIKLIEPLRVKDFHNFLARSYLILTDSGGIQEEAPALRKPVILMRNTTERPEAKAVGAVRVVGVDEKEIYANFKLLLDDSEEYNKMVCTVNPYGNGKASELIADMITELLENQI